MHRFDEHFLAGCECLRERAQRTWGQRFLARKPDRRLANGTEVTEFSDYTSGHDFRYIDWNRCARLDELLSKQFHGTELQHAYLLVDLSPSMGLGSPPKLDFACRVAGTLAYLALSNGNRVGVAGLGAESQMPVVAGRDRVREACAYLDGLRPTTSVLDLPRAVENFIAQTSRPGIAIVIGDFLDPDSGRLPAAIRRLIERDFTPFIIQVYDRQDAEPDLAGAVRLRDIESGRSLRRRLDPDDLANYRAVFQEFLDSVRRCCLYHAIGWVQTATDTPLDACLDRLIAAATFRHSAIPEQLVT